MNANPLSARIEARPVPDGERPMALPRHFGHRMLLVENAVFDWLRELSPDYDGGYWRFLELSNGGFYMVPDTERRFRIEVLSNGYVGRMSADAAGITSCLFAYSHLSFRFPDERLGCHYQQLLAFAGEHAEAAAIGAATD